MSDVNVDSPQSVDRRRFLKVLGVSSAGAAVLSGCTTDRVEKLITYLVQSEYQEPGVATWYASTCTECSAGCGLHVRTREGRAVKLEGNPEHPVNQGKLCSLGQSSLQALYNPARVHGPMLRKNGVLESISWDDALAALGQQLAGAGSGLRILSGAPRGLLSSLMQDLASTAGGRMVRWQPFGGEAQREANQRVFGRDELASHDFGKAQFILSFGADFLETWGTPIEQARGFAQSHGFSNGHMAKHVYVAPRASLTGLNADVWHSVTPGSEVVLALALAHVVAEKRGGADAALRAAVSAHTPESAATATGLSAAVITELAEEFAAASPSLAVAGGVGSQYANATELCAAVNLLNYAAGNVGQTVLFGAAPDVGDGHGALATLQRDMTAGRVKVLLVHEANPLYALPKSTGFGAALAKVPFKVSTALVFDETAAQCDLLLPNLHSLERFDDVVPRNGVRGLTQPVMQPVFEARHTGDVLLQAAQKAGGGFARFSAASFEAYLKADWERAFGAGSWRQDLARGGRWEAAPAAAVRLTSASVATAAATFAGDGEYFFLPHPSPMLHDGRGTNRPWLLENPDPVTKLTWQPWVELHPETAKRLDARNGEIVRLVSPAGALELPTYINLSIRPDSVSVPLGWGHTEYGEFAKDRGVNALDLLPAPTGDYVAYAGTKVRLEKTSGYRKPPKTEGNPRQLGRGIAEAMPFAYAAKGYTVEEAAKAAGHPKHEFNTEREKEALQGWRDKAVEGRKLGAYATEHPQWGMTIDLAKCTGCSACVTACYAENNIPWVGEESILRGRELSWMRIERYWEGGAEGEPVEARFVPMLCQHCDNAPCETVCPVYAAYHTADGLNGQVYNRCVGTRYCANNCPYKVRYFNWLAFAKKAFVTPFNLQLNPDVTVRARGVMEKCTFCVQRIREHQHLARLEDRGLQDGEIVTACQQACPSHAIVFGNLKDPKSAVAATRQDRRGYHILEDLNVRPAVTYLAKVRHVEPAEHAAPSGGESH